jgi:hypothetical protein
VEKAKFPPRRGYGSQDAQVRRAVGRRGGHGDRLRKHTLPPLDDCLDALQTRIPHLTRSALHKRYHYDTHQQLEDHLAAFLDAYNFASG